MPPVDRPPSYLQTAGAHEPSDCGDSVGRWRERYTRLRKQRSWYSDKLRRLAAMVEAATKARDQVTVEMNRAMVRISKLENRQIKKELDR